MCCQLHLVLLRLKCVLVCLFTCVTEFRRVGFTIWCLTPWRLRQVELTQHKSVVHMRDTMRHKWEEGVNGLWREGRSALLLPCNPKECCGGSSAKSVRGQPLEADVNSWTRTAALSCRNQRGVAVEVTARSSAVGPGPMPVVLATHCLTLHLLLEPSVFSLLLFWRKLLARALTLPLHTPYFIQKCFCKEYITTLSLCSRVF